MLMIKSEIALPKNLQSCSDHLLSNFNFEFRPVVFVHKNIVRFVKYIIVKKFLLKRFKSILRATPLQMQICFTHISKHQDFLCRAIPDCGQARVSPRDGES